MTTDTLGAPSPDATPVEVPDWCYNPRSTPPIHRRADSCTLVGCPPLTLPAGLLADLRDGVAPDVVEGGLTQVVEVLARVEERVEVLETFVGLPRGGAPAAARGLDVLIPTIAACGRPHPGDCALVNGICLQPLTPPHRPPPLPDPVIPDTGPDPRRQP